MKPSTAIEAEVRIAKIHATIKVSPDFKGTELTFYKREPLDNGWEKVIMDAPILAYSESYLHADGFICVKLLQAMQQLHKKPYGIFGGFKSWGELRCHLISPLAMAVENDLSVIDWEIIEWTKKTLIQAN